MSPTKGLITFFPFQIFQKNSYFFSKKQQTESGLHEQHKTMLHNTLQNTFEQKQEQGFYLTDLWNIETECINVPGKNSETLQKCISK